MMLILPPSGDDLRMLSRRNVGRAATGLPLSLLTLPPGVFLFFKLYRAEMVWRRATCEIAHPYSGFELLAFYQKLIGDDLSITSHADVNDNEKGDSGPLLLGWYNVGNTIEFFVTADKLVHNF